MANKEKTMKDIFVELVGKTIKDCECLNPAERVQAQATLALALANAGLNLETEGIQQQIQKPKTRVATPIKSVTKNKVLKNKTEAKDEVVEASVEVKADVVTEKTPEKAEEPATEVKEVSERDKLKNKAEVIETTPAKTEDVEVKPEPTLKEEIKIEEPNEEESTWNTMTQKKYEKELKFVGKLMSTNKNSADIAFKMFTKGRCETINQNDLTPLNIQAFVLYVKDLQKQAQEKNATQA